MVSGEWCKQYLVARRNDWARATSERGTREGGASRPDQGSL